MVAETETESEVVMEVAVESEEDTEEVPEALGVVPEVAVQADMEVNFESKEIFSKVISNGSNTID